jgi:4-hydroxy-2-oxoheptanedioate aldolase
MLNGPASKPRRTPGATPGEKGRESRRGPNALTRLRAGDVVFGAIQAIPGAAGTDVAIRAGAEFVILDCEHGLADEAAHKASLRVLAKADAFSAVRVRPHDLGAVGSYARLGTDVILMPNIKSAVAAHAFVAAGSDGPGADPAHERQTAPLLMAMIESKAAVAHIREIVATPGLGGVVVGPNDLCSDFGDGVDFTAPVFQEALVAVERAAADAAIVMGSGVYPGISVSRLLQGGHRFILAASDVGALETGYRSAFDAAHTATRAPL